MVIRHKINLKDTVIVNGRTLYGCKCIICKDKVYRRRQKLESGDNVFCGKGCQGVHQKKGKTVKCYTCKKSIYKQKSALVKNGNGRSFCSRSCSAITSNARKTGKNNPNYIDGRSSYRRKALAYRENVCCNPKCLLKKTFTKKNPMPVRMLDVDHISSNRADNRMQNLQILCVWCHALKTRKVEL